MGQSQFIRPKEGHVCGFLYALASAVFVRGMSVLAKGLSTGILVTALSKAMGLLLLLVHIAEATFPL